MDATNVIGVRFVVLAHERSGSTLLASALGQHPRIVMFGELFNDEDDARYEAYLQGVSKYGRGPAENGDSAYHCGDDGAEFLARIYQANGKKGYAVGFKIHYNQGSVASVQTAWQFLTTHTDIRVIQLERANLLDAYVSLQTAIQTGEWARITDDPIADSAPTLTLDPMECINYFQTIERQARRARRAFRHHRLLHLVYERDLCQRFDDSLRRAQEFLGVLTFPVAPLTHKQSALPLGERIGNFSRLADFFTGSPYEHYFKVPNAAM